MNREILKKYICYCPETGDMFWKRNEEKPLWWNRRWAGKKSGTVCGNEYIQISIGGSFFLAHRLAWLYVYGEWPEEIDHINGDRQDNRIANLRSVSRSENAKNMKRGSRNTSGVTGVSWYKPTQKWLVRVGKEYVGYFNRKESAIKARRQAEAERGYHPNHGRQQ